MILLPKYTDVYNKEPITVHQEHSGEIRMILREMDETVVYDSGWFSNLITDRGLVTMGESSSWALVCNLGSSSTAPAFTDTALYAWMGEAQMGSPVYSLIPIAPNYEYSITKNCRFNVGVATGTIREIGFNSHLDTQNTNMGVRALVSPPVVKAANQVLDVYYKMTSWPDTVDRTGTVMIGGINYNYTTRARSLLETAGITTLNSWSDKGLNASNVHWLTNQTYTTIDTTPASVTYLYYCTSNSNIGTGSKYSDRRMDWSLDYGNVAGGIRTICTRSREAAYQDRGWQTRIGKVSDDSELVKDNTQVLTIDFRVTWDRH